MARLVEARAAKQRDIYPYECAILQIWSGGALHHKNGRPYRAARNAVADFYLRHLGLALISVAPLLQTPFSDVKAV